MRIKIFDQGTAERVQDAFRDSYWISITDIDYPKAKIEAHNKLCLSFDDVTPYNVENSFIHPFYKNAFLSREPVFFSSKMAMDIVNFVHKIEDSRDILCIHCYAGKSRSVAVGAVINTITNTSPDNEKYFREFMKEYCHDAGLNSYVYHVLMTAFLNAEVLF